MSFIDEIKIFVQGGNGGNGNLGYIKKARKKIPYGGPGGKGGDIYIQADNNINNLNSFKFKNRFKAQNGFNGDKNCRKGKNGNNLFIKVPLWTQIYCLNRRSILATLYINKQNILIAKGGNYGLGSKSLKKQSLLTKKDKVFLGKTGENYELLLKIILKNDITILGLPNVGKSTFFNTLTNNFSKIDYYPYTTDKPNIGILKCADYTVLDLPNMIYKDSNEINTQYLKHLKYSKLILFMIDITSSTDDLIKIKIFLEQINLYIQKICSIWLIFNKIDLLLDISYKKKLIKNIIKKLKINLKYFFISAYNNIYIDKLIDYILKYKKTII